MKHTSAILNILPTILSNGPNAETILVLQSIGLNEREIEETISIIGQAIGRAELYQAGMKPAQFSNDLDDNLLFNKTIAVVLNSDITYETDHTGLHPKLKKAMAGNPKTVDFERLLSDFNTAENTERADALYELIENEYPNVSEILEEAIFDTDEMVQIIAIQGIDKIMLDENFVAKMFKLFNATENHTLVSNLSHKFIELELKAALPHVINKLKSDDLMIVYNCIYCLGEIGEAQHISTLQPFKEIRRAPEVYDEDGFLEQTGWTIRKITKKAIKRIKKRVK